MISNYQKALFALVSTVAVCAVIYAVKASPTVPAVGTDMACTGPYPEVIGTNDGLSITCMPPPTVAFVIGTPTSRTFSLATAYQPTDNTKAAVVTINLSSTANISLSGGTTNTATVVLGSTTGVATGTGSIICNYANSNTGTLTIGLNLSTIAATTCTFAVPAGYYFAVRQTAGTITIVNAWDQSAG